MSRTAVPTRITIDFRDAIQPSRTWILGLSRRGRASQLLAFDAPLPALSRAARGRTTCMCPDFCERDHANE